MYLYRLWGRIYIWVNTWWSCGLNKPIWTYLTLIINIFLTTGIVHPYPNSLLHVYTLSCSNLRDALLFLHNEAQRHSPKLSPYLFLSGKMSCQPPLLRSLLSRSSWRNNPNFFFGYLLKQLHEVHPVMLFKQYWRSWPVCWPVGFFYISIWSK